MKKIKQDSFGKWKRTHEVISLNAVMYTGGPMSRDFWLNRWAENQIGFHLKGVNPHLIRFWSRISGEGKGRTLVPLCGVIKTLLLL